MPTVPLSRPSVSTHRAPAARSPATSSAQSMHGIRSLALLAPTSESTVNDERAVRIRSYFSSGRMGAAPRDTCTHGDGSAHGSDVSSHGSYGRDTSTFVQRMDDLVRLLRSSPGLRNKAPIALVREVFGASDWRSGPGDDGAVVDGTLIVGGEAILPAF